MRQLNYIECILDKHEVELELERVSQAIDLACGSGVNLTQAERNKIDILLDVRCQLNLQLKFLGNNELSTCPF